MHFDTATKSTDETFVLFAARLRNLLSYYLSSRGVNEDFDRLCDLLVSDRLKSTLPYGPLNYVLSIEGDDWFAPDRVAYIADTFVNNRGNSGMSKTQEGKAARVTSVTAPVSRGNAARGSHYQVNRGGSVATSPVRRCYVCNKPGHLAKDCQQRGNHGPNRDIRRGGSYTRRPYRGGVQVNVCAARDPVVPTPLTQTCDVGIQWEDEETSTWDFSEHPTVKAVTTKHLTPPRACTSIAVHSG